MFRFRLVDLGNDVDFIDKSLRTPAAALSRERIRDYRRVERSLGIKHIKRVNLTPKEHLMCAIARAIRLF